MVSCLTSYEFAQPGLYLWVILRGRLRASPTVRTEPGSIQRTDKLQFADIAGEHCRQIAAALPIMMKKTAPPVGETAFWCRRVCKPGSVLTAIYLAPQLLTGSSRLLGTVGQTLCSSTALLRDRVYSVKPMLPWAGWALTPPFHHHRQKPAESLCCTCPEVTLGGRYPLSLPCGARTFLIWVLSVPIRGCPTLAAEIFYPKACQLSNPLANSF